MQQSFLCIECKAEGSEFVCLCQFPLTNHLCKDHTGSHVQKTSLAFPHRISPLVIINDLTTKDRFEAHLKKLWKFELTKQSLREFCDRVNRWGEEMREVGDRAIEVFQTYRPAYQQTVDAASQNLVNQAEHLLQEIPKILDNPGYFPQDDLTLSCWEYISDQTDVLAPRFQQQVDCEMMLREFRTTVEVLGNELKEWNIGRERREKEEMMRRVAVFEGLNRDLQGKLEEMNQLRDVNRQKEKTEAELRTALAAKDVQIQEQKRSLEELRKSRQQELDLLDMEHQAELADIQSGLQGERAEIERQWQGLLQMDQTWWPDLVSRINVDTLICSIPYCVLWPLVGFTQRHTLESMDDPLTCLLPTVLCCIGAAINRSRLRQRHGIQGSFLIDLTLYSLGVWNSCLLAQERDARNNESARAYFYRRS